MRNLRILLVEDEKKYQREIIKLLSPQNLVICASSISEAKRLIERDPFDICLLDYKLEDGYGIDLLKELRANPDHGPILFISADGNPATMQKCFELGATDYIQKNADYETELQIRIPLAIRKSKDLRRYIELEERQRNSFQYEIIGNSQPIKKLKSLVQALKDEMVSSILISGPPGSGKKLVARRLNMTDGTSRPFVYVNCTLLKDEHFENEFFGIEGSAFSSQKRCKLGYLELSDRGDLFLDHLSELSESNQSKLLRFLEDGEFRSVGGTTIKSAKFRIISSTNKNLLPLIRKGKFSEDLYHKLNVHPISVPSLKERREDIPALAKYWLVMQAGSDYEFASDVLDFLQNCHWPQNVAELKSNILQAYLSAKQRDSTTIQIADFSKHHISEEIKALLPSTEQDISKSNYENFITSVEKLYWLEALRIYKGNALRLSKDSDIPLSTLNYKIKQYSLRQLIEQ